MVDTHTHGCPGHGLDFNYHLPALSNPEGYNGHRAKHQNCNTKIYSDLDEGGRTTKGSITSSLRNIENTLNACPDKSALMNFALLSFAF